MKALIKIAILLVGIICFSGCMLDSKSMVIENVQQLEVRSYQTKDYDYPKELVARASVAALQDLSFIVDKADMQIGSITATKLQKGATMKMTIVVRSKGKNASTVRVNAQFGSGASMVAAVDDAEVYQTFFNVLDKAVFFETEGIQ